MNLGENIKKLRKRSGLSQTKLAELMEVNQYNISFWEINRSEPSANQLIKLSEIFNVPTDYLLGKKEIITTTEEDFKTVVKHFELDNNDDLLNELVNIYKDLDHNVKKDLLNLIKSITNKKELK